MRKLILNSDYTDRALHCMIRSMLVFSKTSKRQYTVTTLDVKQTHGKTKLTFADYDKVNTAQNHGCMPYRWVWSRIVSHHIPQKYYYSFASYRCTNQCTTAYIIAVIACKVTNYSLWLQCRPSATARFARVGLYIAWPAYNQQLQCKPIYKFCNYISI